MKNSRLLAMVLAGLSLPPAACAPLTTERVAAEVPPPDAVPGPALWQLADADTTIYLLGTVHALPANVSWMDARIERALASSDELVTEIDIAAVGQSTTALASAGRLPAGQNLRAMMNETDRKEYEAALVTLGLPVEALDKMEPWFAAMTLSLLPLLRADYKPDSGVELTLGKQASGKTRRSLETIEDQVALFDGLSPEAQLAFLDQTVEAVPKASNTLGAMVAEWLKGDADQLARLLNAELTDPVLYSRLLTERNARWAEWLDNRMDAPGTVFVAVGAGHLAGSQSVQSYLRSRGFEVTRVWR